MGKYLQAKYLLVFLKKSATFMIQLLYSCDACSYFSTASIHANELERAASSRRTMRVCTGGYCAGTTNSSSAGKSSHAAKSTSKRFCKMPAGAKCRAIM